MSSQNDASAQFDPELSKKYPTIFSHLNSEQQLAVAHLDGPMLVIAGAGSGKTRVVTRRIAYLIANGCEPWQILAMTFTNKAAAEMKSRVTELIGAAPPYVGTFHSLCARFLRTDIVHLNLGYTSDFTIYDSDDQQKIMKAVLKKCDVDDKKSRPRDTLGMVSRAKNDGLTPEECYDRLLPNNRNMSIEGIYRQYQKDLISYNALDFDDLLVLTELLLRTCPEVRQKYQNRFRYILVDEYQDTNRVQYNLVRLLGGRRANVHATGDPDQSIYSWRGADYNNILNFQSDYPQAKMVKLEENYRSTPTILTASNAVIANNSQRIDKNLYSSNENPGFGIIIKQCHSANDEGSWIAEQVRTLRPDLHKLSDIAIFYRMNFQSRSIEKELRMVGITPRLVGALGFYERQEIKDLLAILRLRINHRDLLSLERIIERPKRGVGPSSLALVVQQAEQHNLSLFEFLAHPNFAAMLGAKKARLIDFAKVCQRFAKVPDSPVDQAVRSLLELSGLLSYYESEFDEYDAEFLRTGIKARVRNLEEFVTAAIEFSQRRPDAALGDFLEECALLTDADRVDTQADTVTMMTLHAAKGLEFPVVFIAGAEDGILPHQRALDEDDIEEERRLFYVGMTRAEQQLFVSHARMRTQFDGSPIFCKPSTFLNEIPPDTIATCTDYDKIDIDLDFADDFLDSHLGLSPQNKKTKSGKPKIQDAFSDLEIDASFADDIIADTPFSTDYEEDNGRINPPSGLGEIRLNSRKRHK